MPILAPYKRASSELTSERTVVKARGLESAGSRSPPSPGPARSRARRRSSPWPRSSRRWARPASGAGRSSPGPARTASRAQGRRPEDAGDRPGETGLAIVTEVMAPEHVPMVAKYADVLQIGARNMQNYQLLQAVGDSGKPALLKRGMSATIDEFLLAAEYILDRNNPERHPLRAWDPDLRGPHPVHPPPGDRPLPPGQEPPAGRRRPLARHRQGQAGRADVPKAAVAPGPTA